jgi:hypothetical protein
MLKTVSSVANAIGALNYKGTWNATTNVPTLASGVGTQGDYYVVSVAGATDLNGITNWGVGDWATFNGSVWQRVEGGADGNFVDLSVTGEATIGTISPSYSVLLSARNSGGSFEWGHSNSSGYPSTMGAESGSGSPYIAFNAGPGTSSSTYKTLGLLGTVIKTDTSGNLRIGRLTNASADNQTPVESAVFTNNGNLQFPSGQGIDFSPTAGTGTSELLDDYEEGDWTPAFANIGTGTYTHQVGRYTKVGNLVTASVHIDINVLGTASGSVDIINLPFTASAVSNNYGSASSIHAQNFTTAAEGLNVLINPNTAVANVLSGSGATSAAVNVTHAVMGTGNLLCTLVYFTA